MKIKFILSVLSVGGVLLSSCGGNDSSLQGAWVEKNDNALGQEQGFVLENNDKASSINMATLQYEKWKRTKDQLILQGVSVGNKQSISFSDTLDIVGVSDTELVLRKKDLVLTYQRRSEAASSETVSNENVSKKSNVVKHVKGELVIAPEVRSFKSVNDSIGYWIVDKTQDIYKQYDQVTKGQKNGQPVYVEMEVIDKGEPKDGFALNYQGVYEVVKVHTIQALENKEN